ncbi:MAG: hypothetical protein WCK53_14500, partial [Methanomicrobiales archaeon]
MKERKPNSGSGVAIKQGCSYLAQKGSWMKVFTRVTLLCTLVFLCCFFCPVYGDLYVTDTQGNQVQKFTDGGVLQLKWGSYGTEDGKFNHPMGIATYASNIYVCDGWNNRIQIFDFQGNFTSKFGTYGTGDGQFNNPVAICFDSG